LLVYRQKAGFHNHKEIKMAKYETVFIARQDLSEAQVKELTQEVSDFITARKGTINKTESWGLRNLAYRINKNKKGHYVLIEFEAETSVIAPLEHSLRLNENYLRYLTVRLEDFAKEQSAVLRAPTEREDRPRYGDRDRGDTGYRPRRNNAEQEAA